MELPFHLDAPLEFTPDGTRLIVHGRGESTLGSLLIWDLDKDREVRRFVTDPGFAAMSMDISADGERVAVGGLRGIILLIGLSDGSRVRLDHGGWPRTISWSNNDNRLISAGMGGAKIWELSNETALTVRRLGADYKGRRISRYAISRDGRRVAAMGLASRQIGLYDMSNGKLSRTLPVDQLGMYSELLFSLDGTRLTRFGTTPFQAWNLEGDSEPNNVEASGFKGRIASAGFREDGSLLLGGREGSKLIVAVARTGEIIWQRDSSLCGEPRISVDARLVALHAAKFLRSTRTYERWIEVRDLPGGELRHKFPLAGASLGFRLERGLLNVSPDNRWLL